MIANAFLYFGPLLAGLGGFGWGVVPVFALIFMLWLLILRPQEFPRSLSDWGQPEALVAFGARAAVQVLLVLVCFGVGRGLGGVLGSLPAFPIMLPISVSFLSIPFARMVWNPWQAQEMDQLLDDALLQVENGAGGGSNLAYAEAVLTPLNGLPDTVTEAELESHLEAVRTLVDEAMTFAILMDRMAKSEASVASKRTLMILASDGAALERMTDLRDVPVKAMQALQDDAGLIARLAERLVHTLRQDPDVWHDCPSAEALAELRAKLPTAAKALNVLEAEIAAQAPNA